MGSEERGRAGGERRGFLGRAGAVLLKVLAFFVILGPLWMLLPFAGFLYGSGLQIQVLGRHAETAWLTHFVFPVLTLGPTGPILVVLGFLIFLIGAAQVYTAKIRRSGLVTGGLYRFVRHPQYTALTLFAVGLLLAWGRAIMFLAFFLMMFLYYHLARSEEQRCRRAFGDAYETYRERVSFAFPGDRALSRLLANVPRLPWPRWARVTLSFVLTMAAGFALLWAISAIRVRIRTVPFLTSEVAFAPSGEPADRGLRLRQGRIAGVPYVRTERVLVVRGPWRSAAAPGFAETVLRRALDAPSLADFFAFLEEPSREVAVLFLLPFAPGAGGASGPTRRLPEDPARRGPEPDPAGANRARILAFRCALEEGADLAEAFEDPAKRRLLEGRIAGIDLSVEPGVDFVVQGPRTMGPPGAPIPQGLGEERWAHLVATLAERESRAERPASVPERPVPEQASGTDLVLVQAPILRTRIQPEAWFGREGDATSKTRENHFARDILDHLVRSPSFRERLERSGAGGDRVPVAFPRPGPNWYAEHHVLYERTPDGRFVRSRGTPQVSVFVMLVRRGSETLPYETLFEESRRGERELLGAFIAELDFALDPPADPVHEIVTVGPRRDLEERWSFFLSGL